MKYVGKMIKRVCLSCFLLMGLFHTNTFTVYAQDEQWLLVQEVDYNGKGKVVGNTYYTYDEAGNEIECRIESCDGKEYTLLKKEYDARQKLIKTTTNYNGKDTTYSMYEYDENENVLREVSYAVKDTEKAHGFMTENTYDAKNHRIQSWTHWDDGSGEEQTHKYEYNEKGQMIRETVFDGKDLIDIHEYTYEKNKRIEQRYVGSKDTLRGIYTTFYNEQGDVLKIECEEDGNDPYVMEEYTYDEYGNNTVIVSYDPKGEIIERKELKYKQST